MLDQAGDVAFVFDDENLVLEHAQFGTVACRRFA